MIKNQENDRLIIFSGNANIKIADKKIRQKVEVYFAWSRLQNIRCEVVFPQMRLDFTRPAKLEIPSKKVETFFNFTNIQFDADHQIYIEMCSDRLEIGREKKVNMMVGLIPDFPSLSLRSDINGEFGEIIGGFMDLSVENWQIKLSHVETGKLGDNRTGKVTHHISIKKHDESEFMPYEVEKIVDCINYFLTFSKGSRIEIPILRGFYGRSIVYTFARSIDHVPSGGSNNWLPYRFDDNFEQLFRTMWDNWRDDEFRKAITNIIDSYIQSLSSFSFDSGIVISQIALELMAWVKIVESDQLISRSGFEALPASDRIRLLLTGLGIEIHVPENFTYLKKLSNGNNWKDLPESIVQLRNSIVHPNIRRRSNAASDEAKKELMIMSTMFIEISLLKILKYKGSYRKRVNGEVQKI